MRQERQVKSVILETIKKQKMLSAGILTAVIGAVVAALIPPLILAKIIDTVTAGYAIVADSSGKHNGESRISHRGRKRQEGCR